MAVQDWSKFAEEQAPKKLSLERKRRKRSIQDTQAKVMTMSLWRASVVKPEREPMCDRCECPGEWTTPKREMQNSVQIFIMVRGGGMTLDNAALICSRCQPFFYAQRNGFKMKAHYAKWLKRHHDQIDARNELLARPIVKQAIEQIDDAEFERLLQGDGGV
tara:strand:+ start:1653 stop:2135 length:483 start_codon:yes stop_codon:yes gene_type:complete